MNDIAHTWNHNGALSGDFRNDFHTSATRVCQTVYTCVVEAREDEANEFDIRLLLFAFYLMKNEPAISSFV